MALTKEEHEGILKRIAESGGFTAEMADDLQKLRDEYDEREGMLRRYGERYDGENRDRKDWDDRREEREEEDRVDGDYKREGLRRSREDDEDWRAKYIELKKSYIDRFFNGAREEITESQDRDIERDGDVQTYEELFERREG